MLGFETNLNVAMCSGNLVMPPFDFGETSAKDLAVCMVDIKTKINFRNHRKAMTSKINLLGFIIDMWYYAANILSRSFFLMPFNPEHLRTLELDPRIVDGLSPEDAGVLIRKNWSRLALKYHPDKNHNRALYAGLFNDVTEAYKALTENNVYNPVMNDYFDLHNVEIPPTTFDLLQEEIIEARYRELEQAFGQLNSEADKRAFCTHHAPFLNLAQSLGKIKDENNQERLGSLFAQEKESLISYLTREWRQFIIRLFGEEYLDDFQYRQALASGDLMPIFATRKLFSPVKWAVAVLGSLYIGTAYSLEYLFKQFVLGMIGDFVPLYHANSLDFKKIAVFALKLAGLAACLILPFYVVPTYAMMAFGLPMVMSLLKLIGSPVNLIIRPLATYTGLSPLLLTVLGAVLGAGAIYGLISLVALSSVLFLLDLATLPLVLYSLYGALTLVKKMYDIDPALGIVQGFIMGASVLASFILPAPVIDPNSNETINIIAFFMTALSNSAAVYGANKLLDNVKEAQELEIEVLPLPKALVEDHIKEATLLDCKKATQSCRFFNTPKEADYIKKSDRDVWQQASSFFGDGQRKAAEQHYEPPAVGVLAIGI